MKRPTPPTIRYSTAFQRKIVEEIESGTHSIADVRRIYDIRGHQTIQKWLIRFGKHHLLSTVVKIEKKEERDTLREQREKIRKLESALSDAVLENIVLRATIAELEQAHGPVKKKRSPTKSSSGR
jgi:transposase-like protein